MKKLVKMIELLAGFPGFSVSEEMSQFAVYDTQVCVEAQGGRFFARLDVRYLFHESVYS
jgi:hypothetical protein